MIPCSNKQELFLNGTALCGAEPRRVGVKFSVPARSEREFRNLPIMPTEFSAGVTGSEEGRFLPADADER